MRRTAQLSLWHHWGLYGTMLHQCNARVQAEGGRWSRRRSRVRREEAAGGRSEGGNGTVVLARKAQVSGPVSRAQCRVAMLQSKLKSAELRIAGQCETIKVLETALTTKDGDLQRLEEVCHDSIHMECMH